MFNTLAYYLGYGPTTEDNSKDSYYHQNAGDSRRSSISQEWELTLSPCSFTAESVSEELGSAEQHLRENLMIEHPSIFVNKEFRRPHKLQRALTKTKRSLRRASRQALKYKGHQQKRENLLFCIKIKQKNFNKIRATIQQ